jgi:hypothetical protein
LAFCSKLGYFNLKKYQPTKRNGKKLRLCTWNSIWHCFSTWVPQRCIWVQTKQWLLTGEFSEFEYLPKTCHFWQVRVLAKMAVFVNTQDSPDSPTFAKPFTEDSPDSQTFPKPFTEYSPDSPTFAEPFCKDSPDSRKVSLASVTWIWQIWQIWLV